MTDSSSLIALYPGSFDPFHNGHLAVVTEVAELFGNVVVAVMHNPDKPSGLIPLADRVQLARRCTEHLAGVRVEAFPGLAVQAATATGANFIVKGLRTPGLRGGATDGAHEPFGDGHSHGVPPESGRPGVHQ